MGRSRVRYRVGRGNRLPAASSGPITAGCWALPDASACGSRLARYHRLLAIPGTHHEAALQHAMLLAVGAQAFVTLVVPTQVGQEQAYLQGACRQAASGSQAGVAPIEVTSPCSNTASQAVCGSILPQRHGTRAAQCSALRVCSIWWGMLR